MKKIVTVIWTCMFAIPLFAQFTTNWERCARTGAADGKPSWFGTGTERGVAYGNMGSGTRLYVLSRNGGNIVRTINASTGADIDPQPGFTINVSGQANQLIAINDIEMTTDNVLIAASVSSTTAGTEWYVHVATSEGGAFTRYTLTLDATNERVGDKITVLGSWSAGTVEIWTSTGAQATGKVYVFKTTDQGANWSKTSITLSGTYVATVGNSAVAPSGLSGAFYITGNGSQLRKHDFSGAYVTSSLISTSSSSKCGTKYVTVGGNDFIVSYGYRTDPNTTGDQIGRAYIYNVTTPSSPSTFGVTPLSSSALSANAINGDAAFRNNGDGTITVYVLATDQGISAYTTNIAPLPVQLISFNAIAKGQGVELVWNTSSELNNHGFEVERMTDDTWRKIGFIQGAGTTSAPKQYSYSDAVHANGKYFYRLKQIDRDGKFEYTKVVEATVANTVTEYTLGQNYPNPFNPATKIGYNIPVSGHVSLKVYDMLGKEVATLVNGVRPAGENVAEFDASKLPSGMYFAIFSSAGYSKIIKMALVK